jgi:hypothetical protein
MSKIRSSAIGAVSLSAIHLDEFASGTDKKSRKLAQAQPMRPSAGSCTTARIFGFMGPCDVQ